MKPKLLQIAAISLLLVSLPAFSDEVTEAICNAGKDQFGKDLPEPTVEQIGAILPQLQSSLSASGFLKIAHQCSHDTTRHAALLFRAIEAIGCAPGSGYSDMAISTANHDEETNYKVAVIFKNARENNAEGVRALCLMVAEIDPEKFDVTSLESANELSRLVADFESNLFGMSYTKDQ